jgi:hypothetical protein
MVWGMFSWHTLGPLAIEQRFHAPKNAHCSGGKVGSDPVLDSVHSSLAIERISNKDNHAFDCSGPFKILCMMILASALSDIWPYQPSSYCRDITYYTATIYGIPHQ